MNDIDDNIGNLIDPSEQVHSEQSDESSDSSDHSYQALSQDKVIDFVEQQGFFSDGRVFPLNSYENRVYQVGIEDNTPLVIKIYRPNRWSRDQIQEEHDFMLELADEDISVIPPIQINNKTLFEGDGFLYCLFERKSGRPLELDQLDQLYEVGTQLGRIHQVAARSAFTYRPELSLKTFGIDSIQTVKTSGMLPEYLIEPYQVLSEQLIEVMQSHWQAIKHQNIRLQGDFHPGNILIRDEQPLFVDFDDCRSGLAIQDIWMLLSGDKHLQQQQLSEVKEGYEMFREFPTTEIPLIETYRTLRQLHYAAWLASRWDDPAFKVSFPWFGEERYWSEHILTLKEQLSALQEPALKLL